VPGAEPKRLYEYLPANFWSFSWVVMQAARGLNSVLIGLGVSPAASKRSYDEAIRFANAQSESRGTGITLSNLLERIEAADDPEAEFVRIIELLETGESIRAAAGQIVADTAELIAPALAGPAAANLLAGRLLQVLAAQQFGVGISEVTPPMLQSAAVRVSQSGWWKMLVERGKRLWHGTSRARPGKVVIKKSVSHEVPIYLDLAAGKVSGEAAQIITALAKTYAPAKQAKVYAHAARRLYRFLKRRMADPAKFSSAFRESATKKAQLVLRDGGRIPGSAGGQWRRIQTERFRELFMMLKENGFTPDNFVGAARSTIGRYFNEVEWNRVVEPVLKKLAKGIEAGLLKGA